MPEISKPKPGAEVYAILEDVLTSWHPELVEAGVTIGVQVAWPGEDGDSGKSAVMLHGYECAAVFRITPYKWRVRGVEDAVIEIDGSTWERLNAEERAALIDHEVMHCELVRDKEGGIKSDANGRPKLRTRLHDIVIGGFSAIARRHGEAALEVQEARSIQEAYGQLLFSWAEGPPPFGAAKEVAHA
jgi:Putative phage metallopeptidase